MSEAPLKAERLEAKLCECQKVIDAKVRFAIGVELLESSQFK